MKIGILTFHEADNYGAVLQAYALKEVVKSFAEDVEIIDYKQPFVSRPYKIISFITAPIKEMPKIIIKDIVYIYPNIFRKIKFNQFRKQYCDLTKKVYTNANEIAGKDIYIVGSDQVWNTDITRHDKAYFLQFCRDKDKKIAYAASLGKSELENDELIFLKENINCFDSISMREDSGVAIIRALTQKKITHVLDPTLLLDVNAWNNLGTTPNYNKNYLLIYRLTNNADIFQIANLISKELDLDVLNISNSFKKNPYAIKNIRNVGPCDFIALFKNASFIVTDSFHGTAFSVIFNKNFVTVPHKTRGTRMISLLNLLNLSDRLIMKNKTLPSKFKFNIDYSMPTVLLSKEKQKSLDFLKKAIIANLEITSK